MEVDSDAVNDYKSSLNDLTINSKPQINMLTMLAEDYKDTKSVEIVRCIEQRVHTVSADRMLPLLYLLDSICKNVGDVYIKLFTQNIVSTFCDVFEKVDEKTRSSLYKLRQTWNTIFPVRKLYGIDKRIQDKLDPAWPITAKPDEPKPNSTNAKTATVKSSVNVKPQQQVHVNPKFLSDAKHAQMGISKLSSPVTPEADPWLTKQIIQKQHELLQLEKVKLQNDAIKKQRELEAQERALHEKELKLKHKEHQLQRSNSPNGKKVKKRKRSRSRLTPSPISQKTRSPTHGWRDCSPTDRIRESGLGVNRQQSPSFAMRPTGNAYSPHRHRSRSPIMLKNQYIPQPSSVSLASHQTSALLPTPSQPHVPTTIPAPTILAQPEMLSITSIASSHSDQNSVKTINSIRSLPSNMPVMHHNMHSNIQSNVNTNAINAIDRSNNSAFLWGQDRDYRKEFDTIITEAQEKLRSGAITSADHDILVREMKRAINESHSNNAPPILKAPDTVSMLIDRKSRQLFYLDNTTAIVLLGVADNVSFEQLIQIDPKLLDPRQIRLEGPTTKVFIDNDRGSNKFIELEFNGMEKIFYHYDHEQRIQFGVPAKEIILNGQPYPAKFGGAPIEVYFKGDNCPHSLKLEQRPNVRVKLSDEPCYDLWAKIVNNATCNEKNTTHLPPVSSQKSSDVNNLISKLIAAGMLTNNGGTTSSQQNLQKDEKIEEKEEIIQSIDPPIQLTSDSLKIIRPTVIASLYNGIQCTNCSLRFDDKDQPISTDKTRYSKHLDWHFRQNRRDKTTKNTSINSSTKRNWYYLQNLWCQFKEVTYEDDTTSLFVTEENESDEDQETPLPTVVAEKDESLNFCAVCAEKFEPQWNEDEEEWKLINAKIHNEKIYHPSCLTDYITQQERTISDNEIISEQSDANTKTTFVSDNTIQSKQETSERKPGKTDLVEESLPFIASNCDNMVIDSVNIDVKDNVIIDQMNEQTISDSNVIPLNNCKETIDTDNTEPYIEETKIQVYEYEIPLNNSEVIDDNVQHSAECDKLVFSMEQTKEDVNTCSSPPHSVQIDTNAIKAPNKVLQQGAIVIKMKASNLQQQTTSLTVKDQESVCNDEPQITIKGRELSSLCSIM